MAAARRLAVFDCDGTLVDGQAAVVAAMERAFVACALPSPDPALVRRTVGLSLPQAISRLAPAVAEPERAALVAAYKEAFRAARADGSLHEPLYPGIAALIPRLGASGWALGIATGKSDRGLRLTLAAHGLAHHFATLHTADRHPSKPHPAMLEAAMADTDTGPHETVMIGDTVFDIEMAGAAGAAAIGVAWGYHSPQELRAAGALAVAGTAAELEEMLNECA